MSGAGGGKPGPFINWFSSSSSQDHHSESINPEECHQWVRPEKKFEISISGKRPIGKGPPGLYIAYIFSYKQYC